MSIPGTSIPVIEARGLTKVFPMAAGAVTALSEVCLRIDPGDYVAIRGPSGCGKSTLMHLLGCVETPTSGSLLLEGRDVASLSDFERSRIRLTRIGFVFQRFFLLPMLTAWENIELPQSEAGPPRPQRRVRPRELPEDAGPPGPAGDPPAPPSGGEALKVG